MLFDVCCLVVLKQSYKLNRKVSESDEEDEKQKKFSNKIVLLHKIF